MGWSSNPGSPAVLPKSQSRIFECGAVAEVKTSIYTVSILFMPLGGYLTLILQRNLFLQF